MDTDVIYKMAAINHMITIPAEQEKFIDDHPDFSLSKILQSAITEIMENMVSFDATVREMQRKIDSWKQIATDHVNFIERKGLLDEYLSKNGL